MLKLFEGVNVHNLNNVKISNISSTVNRIMFLASGRPPDEILQFIFLSMMLVFSSMPSEALAFKHFRDINQDPGREHRETFIRPSLSWQR